MKASKRAPGGKAPNVHKLAQVRSTGDCQATYCGAGEMHSLAVGKTGPYGATAKTAKDSGPRGGGRKTTHGKSGGKSY